MKCFKTAIALIAVIALAATAGPAEIALHWLESHPIAGQNLAITVDATNVIDLDTYSFEIWYDTTALTLIDAKLDAPLMNIKNLLRNGSQALLPVIRAEAGKIAIAATLAGSRSEKATVKSGVIGIVVFRVIADPAGKIAIRRIRLLDSRGKPIESAVVGDAKK